jgi:hypothetical protein
MLHSLFVLWAVLHLHPAWLPAAVLFFASQASRDVALHSHCSVKPHFGISAQAAADRLPWQPTQQC